MPTETKKKARVYVATRVSPETFERLKKRVGRANKKAELTNLAAVMRALLEEHA